MTPRSASRCAGRYWPGPWSRRTRWPGVSCRQRRRRAASRQPPHRLTTSWPSTQAPLRGAHVAPGSRSCARTAFGHRRIWVHNGRRWARLVRRARSADLRRGGQWGHRDHFTLCCCEIGVDITPMLVEPDRDRVEIKIGALVRPRSAARKGPRLSGCRVVRKCSGRRSPVRRCRARG